MMNIFIANESKQKLGGGFIFIENLKKGCKGKANFVNTWREAHGILIPSCTMTSRKPIEEVLQYNKAKPEHAKKIILRIDNMPKDSRNRGTAFSRMRDFANWAHEIVFQSEWARSYVGSYLETMCKVDLAKSHIIYNGVDTDYFNYKDKPSDRGETYLFTTYNTDENKRFPEAAYDFHLRHLHALKHGRPLPHLKLVGEFGKYLPSYNFDFFNGEKIEYIPSVSDRKKMSNIYRSCQYLYFPAFADAAPNTVSEAMACGCKPLLINHVGGTINVYNKFKKDIVTIQDMAEEYTKLVRFKK